MGNHLSFVDRLFHDMALASTTRIQKRWLLVILGVVFFLVLFWNQKQSLELTATASNAEIRRDREEMAALRAEMLAMKRSMIRQAVGAGAGANAGATAGAIADDAAAEGCIPCWVKPGLDSLD